MNVAKNSAATDVALVLPPLDQCTKAINYKEQDLCSPQRHNKSKVEIPNDFSITHREAMLQYTLKS